VNLCLVNKKQKKNIPGKVKQCMQSVVGASGAGGANCILLQAP
jgi:hypothetical protein